MKIKRILAGGLAALTTGATLAFGIFAAGLGDYVDGSNVPTIVIGAPSQPSSDFALDVIGAADIAAAMAGYATTTVTAPGAAASVGVSGGVDLSSPTRKLYMGSMINEAKSTLTSQDLPDVLASGSVSVSGVEYKYDQYINIGAKQITFDRAGAELDDPAVYVSIGTSASSPVYNATVVFNKALNVSSSNVQGKKITLFGNDYTIGAQSDVSGASSDKLELFGYGSSLLLEGGAGSQTVTIGGVDHEVELSFVTSDGQAYVIVDGEGDSFTAGESGVLGGVNLYMKNVWPISNTLGRAEISFGSSKLTLENGQEVKVGESATTIDNTLVEITGDSSGISKLIVSVAASDSSSAFATEDQPFTDPVWGTFKLAFNGLTPDPMGSARDEITADNSGTTAATLALTDYRGNEKTLTFAYTESSWSPMLNETSSRAYHVVEGEKAFKNDYVLLTPEQKSEFSHLYQVSSLSSIGSSSAAFQLTDVFSGDSVTVYLTDSNGGDSYTSKTFYVDGQTYHVKNASTNGLNFYWGSGASQTSAGSKITVFPLVKLRGGEYFTLLESASVPDVTAGSTVFYEVPGGDINLTAYSDGKVLVDGTVNNTITNVTKGQIVYTVAYTLGDPGATSITITPDEDYYASQSNNPNFVGAMIYEEENNASVENAVILSINKDSSSYMTVAAPVFTDGGKRSDTLQSDTSVTHYVDTYGTYASYDSDSQGIIKIWYPDTQAVATVAIGSDPVFSEAKGVSGTVESALKITSPVAKLATEVSTSSLSNDLILVGGPCANTLVAQLLESDEQCDNWPYSEGIIKEVSDAFGSGHKALIVAGTKATDTRALAAKVMTGTTSYSN